MSQILYIYSQPDDIATVFAAKNKHMFNKT